MASSALHILLRLIRCVLRHNTMLDAAWCVLSMVRSQSREAAPASICMISRSRHVYRWMRDQRRYECPDPHRQAGRRKDSPGAVYPDDNRKPIASALELHIGQATSAVEACSLLGIAWNSVSFSTFVLTKLHSVHGPPSKMLSTMSTVTTTSIASDSHGWHCAF